MKYLFFDLECANCFDRRGKIYSFGYLVADENLNIIGEEKDILINPNVEKWDWYVVKNILAYTKKEVEQHARFDKRYAKLKALLEDEDTVVCGYSVSNDIGFILDECERYNLPPIKIKFFDVQRLESALSNDKNKSLALAYTMWCSRIPQGQHRSDADARFTYELAKAICEKYGKTLIEFVEQDENYSGRTDGLKYGYNDEPLETRDERHARKELEKYERMLNKKGNLRELKEECKDYILKGSKNELLFLRLLDFVQPKEAREQVFAGKKISISINYEMYNFTNIMKIVQLICDCGGQYVKKATEADIFVRYHLIENGEERKCSKYNYVKEEIEKGKNIEVIEFEEFLGRMGLTEDMLSSMPADDYNYLMDSKYKREKQKKATA